MSQSADVAAFLDGKETLDEPQPKKRGEANATETEKKGDKDAPATRAPGAQSMGSFDELIIVWRHRGPRGRDPAARRRRPPLACRGCLRLRATPKSLRQPK